MLRILLGFLLIAGALWAQTAEAASPGEQTPGQNSSAQDTSGTVRILLRGCDDGVDPQQTPEECDIPLDAPERAGIQNMESGEYAANIDGSTERENDGTYVVGGLPTGAQLALTDFAPTVHNYFMYSGIDQDADAGWDGLLTLQPNETRDITIYYWNGPEGLVEPATSTISLLFRGCPEGVDPNVDSSSCTIPLDAPDAAQAGQTSGTGKSVNITQLDRRADGAYQIELNAYDQLVASNLHGVVHDSFMVHNADRVSENGDFGVYATRNDPRDVTIFYYNSGGSETPPDEPPETGTATLLITFRGCPEGVNPNEDAAACTTPLDAPPSATAQWYSGDSNFVVDYPRQYDGTYVIEGIDDQSPNQAGPPYTVTLAAYQGTEHDRFEFVGVDRVGDHGIAHVELQPGESRQVTVYYYNE